MGLRKIAVIVGSLRKESFSQKIARELIEFVPEGIEFEFVDISQLPLYNQDSDDNPPAAYTAFRQRVKGFDGFLFVTPEHNRSVPAALKNALDIGSRPYAQNVWGGKPAGVVSVSVGPIAGFGANHQLRQSLVCLNVAVMPQPEAYIGNVHRLLGENGKLADESTRKFLAKFMQAFSKWISSRCG